MSQDPNLWFVRGTIHNADGTAFHNQGRILAYHMFPQGGWQWIAESDINSNSLDLKQTDSFIENRVGVQTLATSMAHIYEGRFDFNFKTDKYSPFEGAGAISSWNLSIKGDPSQIEGKDSSGNDSKYSIDDVIIYISYTARKGKEGAK